MNKFFEIIVIEFYKKLYEEILLEKVFSGKVAKRKRKMQLILIVKKTEVRTGNQRAENSHVNK